MLLKSGRDYDYVATMIMQRIYLADEFEQLEQSQAAPSLKRRQHNMAATYAYLNSS